MAEMEMRAREAVEIGCDLTPAISPISFSLHNPFLHSHCSACFSPLSGPRRPHISYCSPLCSAADSPLHFSSAESHLPGSSPPSADLRAALRLLSLCPALAAGDRMFGLLTNREKLLAEDDEEVADRVRTGARAMAAARRRSAADDEESALCSVITNGVEVVDEKGRGIGIAVYGSDFSWINHSCSPNACYRFLLSSRSPDSSLRISPSGPTVENAAAAACGGGYGPRVVVRSIRTIEKGEEITVAYTDLLQPKAARTSELWSKYRFICRCKRCSSSSSLQSYVDRVLEETSASSQTLYNDEAAATVTMLTEHVEEAIFDFLSDDSDPETCCRRLEPVLASGLSGLTLHPLHHLALNSYTALSSAHGIEASNVSEDRPDRFDRARISAAYALFLASGANHLLAFEPSLIACTENYWASAGERLLMLASSSSSSLSSNECSLVAAAGATLQAAVSYADFERVRLEFADCIGGYARRSWGFLSKGCDYLARFDDPMDFGRVRGVKPGLAVAENGGGDDVVQLGAHCLAYGGFLAAVCYGEQSPWTERIQRLLCHERGEVEGVR